MLISSLRGKGRLTRTLIFVNPYNIQEIAPVLDNSLNQKNFTMICNIRDPTNERLKSLYKQIVFPSIRNKIFIQHPHKGLDSQIDKVFPRRF